MAAGECVIEIGENAVWTVRMLSGAEGSLIMEWKAGDVWDARP